MDNKERICGLYLRVSTDDQRDNGYSIDSQIRMLKEYCEKHEYDIIDIYNDAGYSGKKFNKTRNAKTYKRYRKQKDRYVTCN